MRPTPIPDEEIWDGARRVVIGPPGGDLTDPDIASVEALIDQASIGPRISARCVLEDGDLDALTAGGTVWVSFYGARLMPFSVDVQPPVTSASYVRVEADLSGPAPDFRAWIGGVPAGMSPADFAEGCAEALTAMAVEWRAAGDPS